MNAGVNTSQPRESTVQDLVPEPRGTWVNDVHSRLNRTRVCRELRPRAEADLQEIVTRVNRRDQVISVCGSRHAMGGQQFGTDTILVDTTAMDQIHGLDRKRGIVEVDAGIQWPELISGLHELQPGDAPRWTIRQKQTGADRLTLGGALSANAHGRGLAMKPMIEDVEAFRFVSAEGEVHRCSRERNRERFRTIIGGYGLFGLISRVKLRLQRREKVRRHVEITTIDSAVDHLEKRARGGSRYGDFQFSVQADDEGFLHRGILVDYRPVDPEHPLTEDPDRLSEAEWLELVKMAHGESPELFERYADYYRRTDGQVYGSDTHQLSTYVRDYHSVLNRHFDEYFGGSEMITELYVPRASLIEFMCSVRKLFRLSESRVIYGTLRLIEQDPESFLPWAREDFACVIFNLHVDHDPRSVRRSRQVFRELIDRAIDCGGSFYLTYHPWATAGQIKQAYPLFGEFLQRKQRWDPQGRFRSDWYRRYRKRWDERYG